MAIFRHSLGVLALFRPVVGGGVRGAGAVPLGVALELRPRVEQAVLTMRLAAASESPALRVQLARQAVLELLSVRSALSAVADCADSPQHAPIITQLFDEARAQDDYETLADAFAWLERQVEIRTRRELMVNRGLSHALAAAVLFSVGFFALRPTNIARGKWVTASSICGFTPSPPLGQDRLYRVVDGREKEQSFAVCTELEERPWVSVDLGRVSRVDSVVIFPRNDCCYGEGELPISVEVSTDNQRFEQVGVSSRPGTADFPWHFSVTGRHARYVRISSLAKEKPHIVLGEIEVYGS